MEVGTINWPDVYESLRLEAAARGLASLSSAMPSCGSNSRGAEGGEEAGSRSGGGGASDSTSSPRRVKRVAVVSFVCSDESGPKKSRRGCAFVSINSLQSEQSDAAATAEDADATAEDAEATAEDSNAPQVLVCLLLYQESK